MFVRHCGHFAWRADGGGRATHASGLVRRSCETRQIGGEVLKNSVLTPHNRDCGHVEMGLARRSTTRVVGVVCKEGASNENGTAQVE